MPKPVKLLIQRKTKVPTKHQHIHQFRSDWKKVDMIDYEESKQLFNIIERRGIFVNDAQFCGWMREKYKPGIYFISAWRKGYKGFWSFMKVEILEDRFRRLRKSLNAEDKELEKEIREKQSLEMKKKSQTGEERIETEEEIESSQEIIEDIKKSKSDKKRGCSPYLKSCQPMYAWHSFEDFGIKNDENDYVARLI